jgi:hypothetical protein
MARAFDHLIFRNDGHSSLIAASSKFVTNAPSSDLERICLVKTRQPLTKVDTKSIFDPDFNLGTVGFRPLELTIEDSFWDQFDRRRARQ